MSLPALSKETELEPGLSEVSDHELMAQIAQGSEQAFRLLIERHQGPVIGTISKMLRGSMESEDLAQQTFLRVWKHAKRYKPDEKFTTYLYTIVRNLVFNESRRRSRKPSVSSTNLEDKTSPNLEQDTAHQPDLHLLQAELQDAIAQAISELPEKQRLAVVLRRYEDLPYEEIATVLKTSVPSVKSLLFRARKTLRSTLGKYL